MFNSIDRDDISLSIRNGLYMPFMYKGRQIVVHNAAWSFREKIWIDDELVVNEIGFSMASTHVLDVEGDKLEVTFGYRNRMTEVFLEARVGDVPVHEVRHPVGKDVKPATLAMYIVVGVLAGMALGYAVGHLVTSLVGGA
jgi:hypothetical protein